MARLYKVVGKLPPTFRIGREATKRFVIDYAATLIAMLIFTFGFIIACDGVLAQTELSTAQPAFEPGLISCAVAQLFLLIEGPFGALIMVVAGIGAIISAAVGGYRAAVSLVVVAVGAFILRSLVSLFFGSFPSCDLGNGI